jgi:hypothetical protein
MADPCFRGAFVGALLPVAVLVAGVLWLAWRGARIEVEESRARTAAVKAATMRVSAQRDALLREVMADVERDQRKGGTPRDLH